LGVNMNGAGSYGTTRGRPKKKKKKANKSKKR